MKMENSFLQVLIGFGRIILSIDVVTKQLSTLKCSILFQSVQHSQAVHRILRGLLPYRHIAAFPSMTKLL